MFLATFMEIFEIIRAIIVMLFFFALLGLIRFLVHKVIYNYLNKTFLMKYLRNYLIYGMIYLVIVFSINGNVNWSGTYAFMYSMILIDMVIFYFIDYKNFKDKGNYFVLSILSFLASFFVIEAVLIVFLQLANGILF